MRDHAGAGDEELRRAKDHLKGSLMLSLESTSSRMTHLARQEMYFGRHVTLDEIIAGIEASPPPTCSAWPPSCSRRTPSA